jgi:hypothetical protein
MAQIEKYINGLAGRKSFLGVSHEDIKFTKRKILEKGKRGSREECRSGPTREGRAFKAVHANIPRESQDPEKRPSLS